MPEAVLALKQGFGRLIRSKTDRGILAILDNRIRRMQYGRIFLESLPDYTDHAGPGRSRALHGKPSEVGAERAQLVSWPGLGESGLEGTSCTKFTLTKHSPRRTTCAGTRAKCENLHGHNYKVRVTLAGQGTGFGGAALRFRAFEAGDSGRDRSLDHKYLNEMTPFDVLNPSAENIARHIYDETAKQIAADAEWRGGGEHTVWETDVTRGDVSAMSTCRARRSCGLMICTQPVRTELGCSALRRFGMKQRG